MDKSVSKNYCYNLAFQILLLAIPFLTTPYLSRILGAEGVGTYSFTHSIVSYFLLLGILGTQLYGQREIAYVQNDKDNRSYIFWEIVFFRLAAMSISLIVYFIFIINTNENKLIYSIWSLEIISTIFDITWFFQGLEEFKKVIARNFFIKFISLLLIFIFVKSKTDLLIYILINTIMLIIGNLSLWSYLPRYINKIIFKNINVSRHISAIFQFFITQIAVQIYLVVDKTMIGIITGSYSENGYYEQAQSLTKLCLTVIISLVTVMLPQIAFLHAKGNYNKIREYLISSLRFVVAIGIPMMFGLMGISNNLIPWFLGNGYEAVSNLIKVFSPVIVIIGLNSVIGTQLLAMKKQNIYTLSVFVGALINILLNLILIKIYNSIGAAVASVIAESMVLIIQLIYIRKMIPIKLLFTNSIKYLFGGMVMFIIVNFIESRLVSSLTNTMILIFLGIFIYVTILLIIKDSYIKIPFKKIKTLYRIWREKNGNWKL